MSKLMLLEDDLGLINGLVFAFEKAGYEADIARTLQEVDRIWQDGKYDLLILDVSLPDGSGFEVCKRIRQVSQVPIIFLTASDEDISVIRGLDIGGDDYIIKPFKLPLLLSRMKALLRRSQYSQLAEMNIRSGGVTLQLLDRQAWKNEVSLNLTAGEYKLLRFFMENPGIVLPIEQIMKNLWDCNEYLANSNTLTVYIRRLRAKIEDNPGSPTRIVTVRRIGYKWNVKD